MSGDLSDWGDPNGNGERKKWRLLKEKILMAAGLTLIFAAFVVSIIRTQLSLWQFVLAGLALCGISITSWGDTKAK